MHWRALAIYEKKLGTEHPETATILNGLANCYNNQDKYSEAEQLSKRALAIYEHYEKKFGTEEHPFTAIILNGLASLYDNQGKYSEAEKSYKQALAISEHYEKKLWH